MTVVVRNRLRLGAGFEQVPWLDVPPARRRSPVLGLAFSVMVVFSFVWWTAAPEVLVESLRIEGGRVLVCKHLTGTRVVERQYLDPARGRSQQVCPLVKLG